MAGLGRYRVLPAQVIAVGPAQGFAWTVLIDAGSRDGLKVDQTVINGDGLVGRIEVGDGLHGHGAAARRPRVVGRGAGRGQPAARDRSPVRDWARWSCKLLDPQAPLAVGDRLVTRGDGSLYVPGVPVGEVQPVRSTPGSLIRVAEVEPYVNITALDLVGVVVRRSAHRSA